MKTIEYNIPGINCGHCENTIKMEVGELAGVSSVTASHETKTASVTFEPPASDEQIKALLIEINYPAQN